MFSRAAFNSNATDANAIPVPINGHADANANANANDEDPEEEEEDDDEEGLEGLDGVGGGLMRTNSVEMGMELEHADAK